MARRSQESISKISPRQIVSPAAVIRNGIRGREPIPGIKRLTPYPRDLQVEHECGTAA